MGMSREYTKKLDAKREAMGHPTMTWKEVQAHNKDGDTYIVLHNVVYNVSTYMDRHPGGKLAIKRQTGRDATTGFERQSAHSDGARNSLLSMYVADVVSTPWVPSLSSKSSPASKKTAKKWYSCSCVIS